MLNVGLDVCINEYQLPFVYRGNFFFCFLNFEGSCNDRVKERTAGNCRMELVVVVFQSEVDVRRLFENCR